MAPTTAGPAQSSTAPDAVESAPRPASARLIGIDAARGMALIAIICVHILPMYYPSTGRPTLTWILFPGDSPALFALLAGTGLAFTSGGRRPLRGRAVVAARVGIMVRAVLLLALGLSIGHLMPDPPPAFNILIFFAAYFVLTIPFLGLRPRTLFVLSGLFLVAGPLLIHGFGDVLPEFSAFNPTFATLAAEPVAVFWQLLLTGTYPALPYMAYMLAGLAIGRMDLSDLRIQVRLLVAGVGLAAVAKLISWHLLYSADVYTRLLNSVPSLTDQQLYSLLVYGPEDAVPTTSPWWLVIATPDANTPLSVAWSLGVGLAVVGAFQLLARRFSRWLAPLAAMGAMTLTLYYAHLVFLSFEVFYDSRLLWCAVNVLLSAAFALAWQRAVGQGPVELLMNVVVRPVRRAVLGHGSAGTPRFRPSHTRPEQARAAPRRRARTGTEAESTEAAEAEHPRDTAPRRRASDRS